MVPLWRLMMTDDEETEWTAWFSACCVSHQPLEAWVSDIWPCQKWWHPSWNATARDKRLSLPVSACRFTVCRQATLVPFKVQFVAHSASSRTLLSFLSVGDFESFHIQEHLWGFYVRPRKQGFRCICADIIVITLYHWHHCHTHTHTQGCWQTFGSDKPNQTVKAKKTSCALHDLHLTQDKGNRENRCVCGCVWVDHHSVKEDWAVMKQPSSQKESDVCTSSLYIVFGGEIERS